MSSSSTKEGSQPGSAQDQPAKDRHSLRHHLEYTAIRALAGLCGAAPELLTDRAGAALGWLVAKTFRPRWDVVMKQLQMAFPDAEESLRQKIARQSYVHLGSEAIAMFRLAQKGKQAIRERTTISGVGTLEEAAHAGRGVVLVGGHLGNWELGASALSARGFPVDAVVARQRNLLFDKYLTRAREALGLTIIPRGEARQGMLAALRAGRIIGILGDQDARKAGVFVDFFGHPAATARGPALLAIRTGAQMATFFSVRLPGPRPHYHVQVQPVEVERQGNLQEDIIALTQTFTKRLEDHVRKHPSQYFWVHRRWKTPPPNRPDQPSPQSTTGLAP